MLADPMVVSWVVSWAAMTAVVMVEWKAAWMVEHSADCSVVR